MTNPIPGADSERATFEAYAFNRWHYQVSRDERGHYHYKTVQLMWDVWQTARTDVMVDAKVGANVARPAVKSVGDDAPANTLPTWSECALRVENSDSIAKRVAEGGYGADADVKLASELHRFIYEYDDADRVRSAWFMHRLEKLLNEVIATSPPAETPKPMGYDEFFAEAKRLGCKLPDDMLLPSSAQPAPIAGDVEKDAARYRWLVEKFGQTQLPCFLEDKLSHGYIADGKTSIDTAIDAAAMLANSSSGEAG